MKRFFLLAALGVMLLALFCPCDLLRACDPEPGPHHFTKISQPPPVLTVGYFEVFNRLNGLPHNSIRCLLAASGLVLAGTDGGGLLFFRGGEWNSLTPTSQPPFPSLTVNALCRTAEGKILVGTPAGLFALKQKDLVFETEAISLGQQAPSTNILSLKPAARGILIGTDRGAGILENDSVKWLPPEPGVIITGITTGLETPAGILFGGSQGLLRAVNERLFIDEKDQNRFGWVQTMLGFDKSSLIGGSKGLLLRGEEEEQMLMSDVWISSLCLTPGLTAIPGDIPDRRNELDQMDQLKGVLEKLEQGGGQTEQIREFNKMTEWFQNPANWNDPQWSAKSTVFWQKLNDIPSQDLEQKRVKVPLLKGLWIGTQESGLMLWSDDGKRRHFTTENSRLTSNRITAIDGLENGETWIGTQDGGIIRYRSQSFSSELPVCQVYQGKTEALKVLGERVMVGTTRDGLRVYDPVSLDCLAHYHPGSVPGFHQRVTGFGLDPKGALWVGGDHGVWRFDGTTWRGYDSRHGLATDSVRLLEVDADGRVFVVCGSEGTISEQLYQFDGSHFISYSKETIRSVLKRADATEKTRHFGLLGLQKTYMREFDLKNASVSLALYDQEKSGGNIEALLTTPYFLLLGCSGGQLVIFDGEGFKPISARGPGALGRIVFLGRLPGDDLIIVGGDRVTMFDGEHFKPLPGISGAGMVSGLTSGAFDDLSPEQVWVSYQTTGGGGVALQQGENWVNLSSPQPVERLAVFEPFLFQATPEGVLRRPKR